MKNYVGTHIDAVEIYDVTADLCATSKTVHSATCIFGFRSFLVYQAYHVGSVQVFLIYCVRIIY